MTKTVTRQTNSAAMDYHKYDRWFMIAKTLLVLAPFVALVYLQASAGGSNLALLLRNTVYLVMMLYLMYLVYRMTGITPPASLRAKWNDHFFRDLSGCFVLILFGAFCLFVSLRLGIQ